jgi:hypothetical protein
MNKLVRLTILIIFGLISCSEDNSEDNHEGTFFSEEIETRNKNGTSSKMKFNEKHILTDSVSYNNNGDLHGVIMHLDTEENIKEYYTYKDGVKNGEVKYYYYPDGILKFKGIYVNDINHGENYFYDKNGRITAYEFVDSKGRLVFQRTYDSLGEIKKSEGFLGYYNRLNKDTISLSDSLYIELIMGRPPFTNVYLYIGDSLKPFTIYTNASHPAYIESPKDTGWVSRRVSYEIVDTISGNKEHYSDYVVTYVIP